MSSSCKGPSSLLSPRGGLTEGPGDGANLGITKQNYGKHCVGNNRSTGEVSTCAFVCVPSLEDGCRSYARSLPIAQITAAHKKKSAAYFPSRQSACVPTDCRATTLLSEFKSSWLGKPQVRFPIIAQAIARSLEKRSNQTRD